jgi:hypothetical protein
MLRNKMTPAIENIQKIKLAANNPEMKKILQNSIPLGFENIKEDEKGAYFDEILSFLKPFLSEMMIEKIDNKEGLENVITKMKEHIQNHPEQKKKINGINEC